jgi:hypothetical protein
MLYELREYVAVTGRFAAMVDRFHAHAMPLFEKYDMGLVYLGTTALGDNSFNEFVYALRFQDAGDMERKWAQFLDDPEWVAAATESEVDGPLIATLRRRLLNTGEFAGA